MPTLRQAHVQGFYRPLVIGFVVVAILLIGGVIYASAGETVIRVTPTLSSLTTSFSVTIGPDVSGELALVGSITAEPLTTTVIATPTGEGAKVPAHASGTVTITNTTGSNQPLSAGTRLQHENGTIVRTTTRLDVPAKGKVDATVVADPLGEAGNLPPGHFIIVALRPANQSLIFGDSATALTGGLTSQSGSLSLEALTDASNKGEADLKEKFGVSRPGGFKTLVPVSVGSTPPANQPADSYQVAVEMKGLTVTYTQSELDTIVRARLAATLKDDQEIASIENPVLTFDSQPNGESAVLKVTVTGLAQVRADSAVLSPAQFVGLDREAIAKKLRSSDLVTTVQVEISPWWRTTAVDDPSKISVIRVVQ